jgi:hypothetical protein
MSKGFITKQYLDDIADAIREKLDVSYLITPLQFPSKIASISGDAIAYKFLAKTIEKTVEAKYLQNTLQVHSVRPYCFENCTSFTGSYELPLCEKIGTRAFASTKVSEIVLSNNIRSIATDAFSGVTTPICFVIDRPENFVYGYPWGASYATIEWLSPVPRTVDGSIIDKTVSKTSRIYRYIAGGNGSYKSLDTVKSNETPKQCEELMNKGWNYGEYYLIEDQLGANRSIVSDSPMDIDSVRIYLGRYSGNNKNLIVTVEYKDVDGNWIEIQDVDILQTIPYPINYFEISMPPSTDIYGIRWIHKKEPKKSRDNNICFFGFVLYKDGSVVPQYENSELVSNLAEVTSVRSYCFENCTKIVGEINLPMVETINTCAFQGCTNISAISLGPNLTSIGSNAFKNSGIKTITIQKASGSVSGSPWGASGATVVWNG